MITQVHLMLLDKDKSVTVHVRNIQTLAIGL